MTWSGVTSFSLYGGAGNGTPLPVVLGDFSGEFIAENKVKLAWTTEAEINCDYFILEKLNRDNRFTSIAQLSGAGATKEKTNYDFTDLQAKNGGNFYRLTQVDFNGEGEIFPVLKVSASRELETTAPIAVEADRANQTIRLNDASIDHRNIIILNTQGQEMGMEVISHNEEEFILKPTISERSVYLLLLIEGDGNAQNLKFVW